MKKDWDPQRLDVRSFARVGATISGLLPLSGLPRLLAEQDASAPQTPDSDPQVHWTLSGSTRDLRGGAHQTWMQVQAQAPLQTICQRCLAPMRLEVQVDRPFRFVSSEQAAEAEDDQAEEDLLVATPSFDALTLIEDELILALPLVPRHDDCLPPTG